MTKPNNPPAFPVPPCPIKEEGHGHSYDDDQGMSLRDYFAIGALQGMLSHENGPRLDVAPTIAYQMADALLAEREKQAE